MEWILIATLRPFPKDNYLEKTSLYTEGGVSRPLLHFSGIACNLFRYVHGT
jgi:hypothetical protein